MKRRSFLSAIGLSSIMPVQSIHNKLRYISDDIVRKGIDTPWDFQRGLFDVLNNLERYPVNRETLQIHTINVSSADATLVVTPNNDKILVDCGHNISNGWYVQEYLRRHNIRELDRIVFTHGHWDHIGGFERILRNYGSDCEELIETEYENDTAAYKLYKNYISDYSKKVNHPTRGDIIETTDKDVQIRVVNPPTEKIKGGPRPLNDNSLVLRVEYKNSSILLSSDVERRAEKSIVNSGIEIQSDIMRVPHHGGRNASTEQFLREVDPRVGILSCAHNDRFSRPHSDALNRISDQNARLYWTGVNGSVVSESDGSEWVVHKQMNMDRDANVKSNPKVWKPPFSGYNSNISDTIS